MTYRTLIGSPAWTWIARVLVVGIFAGLVAFKLYLLLELQPFISGDAVGYIKLADQIMVGDVFARVPDLQTTWQPLSAFRMFGYPLVIAAAKLTFGGDWAYAVVVFQCTISLLATYALYQMGRDFSGFRLIGIAAASVYAVSSVLFFDQAILTDALHNSLVVIIVGKLARLHFAVAPLSGRRLAAIGSLVALAFLIRETQLVLMVLYLPLVVAYVWAGSRGFTLRITLLAAFVAPSVLTATAYRTWNYWRTGESFITTSSQTFLWPLIKLVEQGVPVFSGTTLIDRVAPPLINKFDFADVANINIALFRDHKLDAIMISRLVMDKLTTTMLDRPNDFAHHMLRNALQSVWLARPGIIPLIDATLQRDSCFGPVAPQGHMRSLCDLQAQSFLPSRKYFLFSLVIVPLHLVTVIMFGRPPQRHLQIATGLWIIAYGLILLYSPINMEIRYVLPTFAFLLGIAALYFGLLCHAVIGTVNIVVARRWLRRAAPDSSLPSN